MELFYDDALHMYLIDGEIVPGLTDIFVSLGIINKRWYTEQSRGRGELVHKITELYDQGTLDESTVDPALTGYLEAYKLFLSDFKPEILEIELPVGHKALKYGSKIDRVMQLVNGKALVDIKSGTKERWHGLQLTAQRMAYSPKRPMLLYDLYLKESGKYDPEPKEYIDNIWLSAINIYNWKVGK